MNPDEPGSIFQAPIGPHVEEHPRPTVDGSDEARRRLRHPFDVPRTDASGPRPDVVGARRGGEAPVTVAEHRVPVAKRAVR